MILINPNGEFPRFIGDLQNSHPSYTQGDPLPDGWLLVTETTPPEVQDGYEAVWGDPIQTPNGYETTWVIQERTIQGLPLHPNGILLP